MNLNLINWDKFSIPVPKRRDYGIVWNSKSTQLIKELYCFNAAMHKDLNEEDDNKWKFLKHRSPLWHALIIIQLLWGDEIELQKTIQGKVYFNTYFIQTLHFLCKGVHIGLTGPASSAKTFTSSVYFLLCFYAAPRHTTVLISTTSGVASERRIWGDIQALHRSANFIGNKVKPIGRIVSYLKALTVTDDQEIKKIIGAQDLSTESSVHSKQKDLRNGLIVIPIADDSTGDSAINTIMGTKNKYVYWGVDELPAMRRGVLRVRSNLVSNLYVQIAGIGNAYKRSDPHGEFCEPKAGWDSIDVESKKIMAWRAKTCIVLYLNGEDSPNDQVPKELCTKKKHLPFPYLCNRFFREEVANDFGLDSIEYWRFARGFWLGDYASPTILSESLIKVNGCDLDPDPFYTGTTTVAGFDCAFASGGDSNDLMFADIGQSIHGGKQFAVDMDSITINPAISNREEYRKAVATKVVEYCRSRGVEPRNFFMDISADGGLMMKEIMEVWSSTEIMGLSSLEPPSAKNQFQNKVSEYWFTVQLLAKSGILKGFNCRSRYASDLFARHYETNSRGVVSVESKKDMKKRIHRSPDAGDAFCYMVAGAKMRGFINPKDSRAQLTEKKEAMNKIGFDFYTGEWKKNEEVEEYVNAASLTY